MLDRAGPGEGRPGSTGAFTLGVASRAGYSGTDAECAVGGLFDVIAYALAIAASTMPALETNAKRHQRLHGSI